jgi:DNA-binding transcriptional MocR family regulator
MNKNPSGYQAVADAIRRRIMDGRYTPGEKIPSIRQFAGEFQCNKLTVQRAFDSLKREGLVENRVGSGTYIRFPEKITKPPGIFDFHTDYLDESFFPHEEVQRIFNRLFKEKKAHALAPAPTQGDADLIHVLSHFYRVPAARMVIISGAQQGLDLVAKVFSANISDSILFEDPTYPGAISLFRARHFVNLEEDGPNLDDFIRKMDGSIRLFYAMPTVHNPTGIAYSQDKKEAIADLAAKHDFYIIEDGFLSEFRKDEGARFVDICPEATIYIKSLSQTTVAGIRLGFIAVPEKLYKKFLYAKFTSDIASFGLMQRCMQAFIAEGLYRKHLDRIEPEIRHRKKRLLEIIRQQAHLSVAPHQAGYSLWIKNRKKMDSPHMPWTRGDAFSFSPEARSFFRLSFMHMDNSRFEQGLDYLRDLLR